MALSVKFNSCWMDVTLESIMFIDRDRKPGYGLFHFEGSGLKLQVATF